MKRKGDSKPSVIKPRARAQRRGSERKSAEAALQDAASLLRAVLSNAPITIFATDSHGVFTLSEGKGLERVGLKPGENVGVSALDLYGSLPFVEHAGQVTTGKDIVRRALAGETVTAFTELRGVYFDNHIGPLRDKDGKVIGLVGVATDITERKRAEQALQASEKRFRALFENSADGIALVGADGTVLYQTPSVNRILGYAAEERVGRSAFELLHPDDIQIGRNLFAKLTQEPSSKIIAVFRFRHKEGSWRWFEVVGANLLDEPSVKALVANYRDVTERTLIEERLRESEERYRNLVELSPDMISAHSEGKIIYANPATAELVGVSRPQELIGRSIFEFVHPNARQSIAARLEEINRAGEQRKLIETQFTRLDGKVINIEVSSTPVTFQGKAARQVIVRDITERKHAEESLRESEERLRVGLKAANIAVFNQDTDLRYVWMYQPQLGYVSEQVVGHTDAELLPLEAAKQVMEIKRRVLEGGLRERAEVPVSVGGENFVYDLVAEPLRDVSGAIIGLTGASLDITERKRAEEERARLYEQMRASRERLRQLAQQVVFAQEEERQRISHELHDEAGQALTALKISLELAQGELPANLATIRERLSECIAMSETTLERIHLLAQNLRPPGLDAVGLGATLEGFCLDFARRTQLSIDYAGMDVPTLPEAVTISFYRFLQDALTNVVKHARASHVEVVLSVDADAIGLSVEDDGQGFDVQSAQVVSARPKGIGLIGMQERFGSLGGRVEIVSQPGQGTRLIARVPRKELA
ncbi:MAG: PAS domain S-box protein [Chloroflexota bacterium]|nr:PAS domain S-box protein [Chloroflexota bacterium]